MTAPIHSILLLLLLPLPLPLPCQLPFAVVLSRYHQLTTRIDAFFSRVASRHASDLKCASGCDLCCHQRLTITAVEAAAIRDWALTLSPDQRDSITAAARSTDLSRCSALDPSGRCRIYAARPLVCRSHGIPIRLRDSRSLPVITSCELNFNARGPDAADPDCILDQELISTMLGLVDRECTTAAGAGATAKRVDLADVLTTLAP